MRDTNPGTEISALLDLVRDAGSRDVIIAHVVVWILNKLWELLRDAIADAAEEALRNPPQGPLSQPSARE